ncbi:DNA polymerase I [Streptobacillus moniliformis]|uniref:DNA polymerase I n=2 Tax=Streptobacillus moniliformis TaxID=34105 RepID=D1AV04_STRM9|nr:DNA polymerase I [Streptobacillus moniliformis]ACZ01564.1 DNA polymerase I [Streptobacillus moniliformis DSM 12112]AVL43440.1 DNA polymerase I [Streptobacillus moniliformis]SQA13268.1 DNA polymerase I [Streptobacillus moniliformis]
MKKILILDTSAIMYRAYFALMNFRNSNGEPVGAMLGFIKQLELALSYFSPEYVIAAKDVKRAELKRREIYKEYKENRSGMPDELVMQLDAIDGILEGYGIPIIKIPSYEADDVIASISKKYSKDYEIIILTGDKDLAQLINPNTSIALLGKKDENEPYKIIENDEDVIEYLGVKSYQIKDLFGLIGDSSDGIPGVLGIGPKTGAKLIAEYDNIDNIYANIDNIKGALQKKIIASKDLAYISRELATVFDELDIDLNIEDAKIKEKDFDKLSEIYLKYELRKEYEKLVKDKPKMDLKINEIEYPSLNDFITKINSVNEEISIYLGEEGIAFCNKDEVHYTFDISEEIGNLFEKGVSIRDIDSNLNVCIYSGKEWKNLGINFKNYFDILLASFTLGTDKSQKLETMAFDKLGLSIEEIDKKILNKFDATSFIEYRKNRLITMTYAIFKLKEVFMDLLEKENQLDIYLEEKEFTDVLIYMEKQGIAINQNYFEKYNLELEKKIKDIENKIYIESGESFNISSPKQLGEVLFETMGIEGVKKNKRGYSTDAEVLELLRDRGIKIAELLLEYRELVKLKSTYVEPLLKLSINGRIHTTYNQTGTATGRLSSSNPNLQNIPTRTYEGTKIREGFIASKGMKLVSFDYSQIELRVLAEISKDENLINAYKHNLDLHELTARKIFMLKDDEKVSKTQRNIAKVINFSVLYGKTPFGLSKELKITVSDAKLYINTYFKEYPKVRILLDDIIEKAKKDGYVETKFGTRRYVYDINSSNINIKEQAKRMAVNTVIQGTAANIIKKVMKEIYDKLCNDNVKMLLQVHDELIFEVREDINIFEEIRDIMQNTIVFDDVVLKVNGSEGDNWAVLK